MGFHRTSHKYLKQDLVDFRHFLMGSISFHKVQLLNIFILNFLLLFPYLSTSHLCSSPVVVFLNLVIFQSRYAMPSQQRELHRNELFSNFVCMRHVHVAGKKYKFLNPIPRANFIILEWRWGYAFLITQLI